SRPAFKNKRQKERHMTIYPIEFHRHLEQKWASRIEQILKMMTRAKTKRTKTSPTSRRSSVNPTKTSRYGTAIAPPQAPRALTRKSVSSPPRAEWFPL